MPAKRKGPRKGGGSAQPPSTFPKRARDLYEDEEIDESVNVLKRYDDVDVYEYELPSDFEDEDIDSDDEALKDGDDDDDDVLSPTDLLRGGDSEDDDIFSEDDSDGVDLSTILDRSKVHAAQSCAAERREERTESRTESEFGLMPSQEEDGDDEDIAHKQSRIALGDLLHGLKDTVNDKSLNLLKSQMSLISANARQRRSATLMTPTADSTVRRLTRQEALDEAKSNVSRWSEAVAKNRQAPQLVLGYEKNAPALSNVSLATKFEPRTEMEKVVRDLLEQSQMDEKQVQQFEDLAMNNLSAEEVKQRRAELKKMRSIMFYYEQKRSRINKIKSRKYHKILKKSKGKISFNELSNLDPEAAAIEREKLERDRARERVSLRHKNQGKWVKRQLARGGAGDQASRTAIQEQLNLGEELRKKLIGKDSSSDEHSNDDNDESDYNTDEEKPALWNLEKEIDDGVKMDHGIFRLKFMQRAMEQQKAEAKSLLKELQEGNDDEVVGEANTGTSGRRVFESKKSNEKSSSTQPLKSVSMDPSSDNNNRYHKTSVDVINVQSTENHLARKQDLFTVDAIQVDGDFGFSKNTLNATEMVVNEDYDDAIANDASLNDEDDHVANPWLTSNGVSRGSAPSGKKITRKDRSKVTAAAAVTKQANKLRRDIKDSKIDNNGSVNSSLLPNIDLSGCLSANPNEEEQRALVRSVFFSSVDEEAEFDAEKQGIVEKDLPKEKDDPKKVGWGSWAGIGAEVKDTSAADVRREQRRSELLAAAASSRKDANLKHVIINEKTDKKNLQYMTSSVPFPYQNPQQFERSIRAPIGKDWNTAHSFAEMTKPKIVTKPGAAIQPLRKGKLKEKYSLKSERGENKRRKMK